MTTAHCISQSCSRSTELPFQQRTVMRNDKHAAKGDVLWVAQEGGGAPKALVREGAAVLVEPEEVASPLHLPSRPLSAALPASPTISCPVALLFLLLQKSGHGPCRWLPATASLGSGAPRGRAVPERQGTGWSRVQGSALCLLSKGCHPCGAKLSHRLFSWKRGLVSGYAGPAKRPQFCPPAPADGQCPSHPTPL